MNTAIINPPSEITLAAAALRVALSQDGVQESPRGSNGGPEVTIYLKSVGLGPGYAWCMAFVYWCVQQAASETGVGNPLVKTAGVLQQWNNTTCRRLIARSSGVKPGDIFIMDFGKGVGHTGFVESVKGGIVHTIEGNTNDGGSREGYEVCRRERLITSVKGFIQLP
ncbi:CHAP domain-containing protein [Chitinophaga agrisoli]|uniref:CHAP domain-containing protein n=1 Tax=Chitinophaga agrisoli TaxID=2607653 RepID=A0A5B2W4K9_9BACT|nr:CHAP domain-containing protein [Chitinophaga agrisoli]KAA2245496.1 CHAP domain-containing protein [Chitinophaga agrisoli]